MAQPAASDGLDGRPATIRATAPPTKLTGTDGSSTATIGNGVGPGPGGEGGKNDVDQLQDIFGMSGVNLRDEEAAIHGPSLAGTAGTLASGASGAEARRREAETQPTAFYLEIYALSHRIHKITQRNGLGVDPDVLALLSTAAQVRSRNLLASMVSASRHRRWSSHLREPPAYTSSGEPMYQEEVYDDPQKLLSALARVEKAEEQEARQSRMQRDLQDEQMIEEDGNVATSGAADVAVASSAENAAQEDAKRKAKRPGGVSAAARNMTEDKRLKLANKTAAQALGISAGSKAWMFGGGDPLTGNINNSTMGGRKDSGSRLPKPRFAPPTTAAKPTNAAQGKLLSDDNLRAGTSMDGGNDDGTGEDVPSATNPGGWGDLAARQRHKEEEERKRTQRVNLEDALHALDMERKGGAGRGSGDRVLYTTRALGRPTLPSTSGLTSIG